MRSVATAPAGAAAGMTRLPSTFTNKENKTLLRNGIIVLLLVALMCAMFLPFMTVGYDKIERVTNPETGRREKIATHFESTVSVMSYLWKPYNEIGKQTTAILGSDSPVASENFDIYNVALIPLLLMLVTVLAAVFGLKFHKAYFGPGFSGATAVFGLIAYLTQPFLRMQPLHIAVMIGYALVLALSVWSCIALKREKAAEKADPHWKLAHYNEQPLFTHIRKNWMIYSFLIIPVVYFVVFRYLPMLGNLIAFRTYRGGANFMGSSWRGLEYFSQFTQQTDFWRAFRNNLRLSIEYLIIRFPMTLLFALLLNELINLKFKKVVQTISYLPHFISTVILVGMVKEITSLTGPINGLISAFGGTPINFIGKAEWFPTLYIVSGVWQGIGWGTILYLAAMTNINTELYEAAEIDGASRFRKVWHVTIPGILPTICTLLVLDIGGIMGSNFEKILLMYNPLTYETADVISTYVYRMGVTGAQFSFSTAVGLFEGIIGLVLVTIANMTSRKLTDSSLW